jgi:hypothetical protein
MHQRLHVILKISSYKLMQYYEGDVDSVVAKTTDGRVIKFPANILRSVVQSHGVYGTFELVFNKSHKFMSIRRVSD